MKNNTQTDKTNNQKELRMEKLGGRGRERERKRKTVKIECARSVRREREKIRGKKIVAKEGEIEKER